jgi:hypothetical protein
MKRRTRRPQEWRRQKTKGQEKRTRQPHGKPSPGAGRDEPEEERHKTKKQQPKQQVELPT